MDDIPKSDSRFRCIDLLHLFAMHLFAKPFFAMKNVAMHDAAEICLRSWGAKADDDSSLVVFF